MVSPSLSQTPVPSENNNTNNNVNKPANSPPPCILSSENVCEIIFMRHGETDWNKEHRIQGRIDIPLNNTGRAQVKEAAQRLSLLLAETPDSFSFNDGINVKNNTNDSPPLKTPSPIPPPMGISRIYSSPLTRAVESAEILAEVVGFDKGSVCIEKDITEWNAGCLQGHLLSELEGLFPVEWKSWRVKRDPHYVLPDGESFAQRHNRVVACVQSLADRHLNQRIVVVCHGGVLDEIFRRAKCVPLHNATKVPKINAGVYILHVGPSTTPNTTASTTTTTPTTTSPTPVPRDFPSSYSNIRWRILRWGERAVPKPSSPKVYVPKSKVPIGDKQEEWGDQRKASLNFDDLDENDGVQGEQQATNIEYA